MTSDTYIDGLVSVIMPMHNSASFLREAIDSVLAQTYTNWELLIVDDASTDNSLVLANEFAKILISDLSESMDIKNIKVIDNSNNFLYPFFKLHLLFIIFFSKPHLEREFLS